VKYTRALDSSVKSGSLKECSPRSSARIDLEPTFADVTVERVERGKRVDPRPTYSIAAVKLQFEELSS
jgi:hypothetical protein